MRACSVPAWPKSIGTYFEHYFQIKGGSKSHCESSAAVIWPDLKADHREVEGLFEQFEKTSTAAKKQSIARQICIELKIHALIEEELFYPAFRGKIEDDTLDEAYVEHDGAKVLINDIEAGSPDDDFYDAKVKVLSEEIKHHVHEEEMQSEGMFAQCRKTDVDLVALRDLMLARKSELQAQATSGALPPAKPTAVNLMPT